MNSFRKKIVIGVVLVGCACAILGGLAVRDGLRYSADSTRRMQGGPSPWALSFPDDRAGIVLRLEEAISRLEKPRDVDDRYFAIRSILHAIGRSTPVAGIRGPEDGEFADAINQVGKAKLLHAVVTYGFDGDRHQREWASAARDLLMK